MVVKWLWGILIIIMLTQNVDGESLVHDVTPLQVLITCMSVLHVMADQVAHPDHVLWQSTATIIHAQLHEGLNLEQHAHVNHMQHVIETHVMFSLMADPHMRSHWLTQAVECQHALVHLMSNPLLVSCQEMQNACQMRIINVLKYIIKSTHHADRPSSPYSRCTFDVQYVLNLYNGGGSA